MSVAYTSTSFGAAHSGSIRHEQRQSSSSSHSSTTFAPPPPAQDLPPPVTAHSPTRPTYNESAMRMQYDAIGAFFGGGRQARQSRDNNSGRRQDRSGSTATFPPSYDAHTEVESLPTYTKVEEYDAKFNRKLFKWGFLLPLFWVVCIITPFVKPCHDPARDNRSKEDQEADYVNMRKVEMRWARRSAIALLGYATIGTIVAVTVVCVEARKN